MISVNFILISVFIIFFFYCNIVEMQFVVFLLVVIFLVMGMVLFIFVVLLVCLKVINVNVELEDKFCCGLVFFGNFVYFSFDFFVKVVDDMF